MFVLAVSVNRRFICATPAIMFTIRQLLVTLWQSWVEEIKFSGMFTLWNEVTYTRSSHAHPATRFNRSNHATADSYQRDPLSPYGTTENARHENTAQYCGKCERFCCEKLKEQVKGKSSPYSITERRVPVLGSQPAGDVSHIPGGMLPLLSARPAVTLAILKRAATNFM